MGRCECELKRPRGGGGSQKTTEGKEEEERREGGGGGGHCRYWEGLWQGAGDRTRALLELGNGSGQQELADELGAKRLEALPEKVGSAAALLEAPRQLLPQRPNPGPRELPRVRPLAAVPVREGLRGHQGPHLRSGRLDQGLWTQRRIVNAFSSSTQRTTLPNNSTPCPSAPP